MEKLSDLPNLSKVLENELIQANISTPEELKALGTEKAFLQLQSSDKNTCFNKLCALEGAIQGMRWHNISANRKEELREFYRLKNIQK